MPEINKNRIWVINTEEVTCLKEINLMLVNHLHRYFLCVRPGDIFITTHPLDKNFVIYVQKIKKLPLITIHRFLDGIVTEETFSSSFSLENAGTLAKEHSSAPVLILQIDRTSTPYSIVNEMRSAPWIKKIITDKMAAGNEYLLTPFIESRLVSKLAKEYNLTTNTKLDDIKLGLIDNINDKYIWKNICSLLKVNTLASHYFTSKKKLLDYLQKLSREEQLFRELPSQKGISSESLVATTVSEPEYLTPPLIVKKTRNGGGYGNLQGPINFLIHELSTGTWYGNEDTAVIVEEFAPHSEILGSLLLINDQGVKFLGIDRQLIKNNSWNGAVFPYKGDSTLAKKIKNDSINLGNYLFLLGARGFMNIDWLTKKNRNGSNELYSLECNFRHNGFSYMLNVGGSLGTDSSVNTVNFHGGIKLKTHYLSFSLAEIISKIEMINYSMSKAFIPHNYFCKVIVAGIVNNGHLPLMVIGNFTHAHFEHLIFLLSTIFKSESLQEWLTKKELTTELEPVAA